MSLIKHNFFPRSMLDYDIWHRPLDVNLGPSTLDLFDPFDALDHTLCRNLHWLDRPDFLEDIVGPVTPKVPHKYRIKVDCHGFNPNSIKTEITSDKSKLIVSAKEGETTANDDGDYSVKEFRRTYKLPNHVEVDKMVSFVTGNSQLVVEFPVLEKKKRRESGGELFPVVSEDKDGNKKVCMNLDLPANIDPSKVKVVCKDRDVIVQAEDKVEKPDGVSQFYYYRRSTMPENTDFDALKCSIDKNKLSIEAPCHSHAKLGHRNVPIENKQEQNAAIKN